MTAVGLGSIVPDHRAAEARMPSLQGSLMALPAGSTAVYPGQGPCRIGRAVNKVVDGRVMMFLHLTVLDGRGGELFVPVEKARAIGVRLLMKESDIPLLLAHLKKSAKPADNWKQRANDNLKLFNSGSPFDLAEVVASLTELQENKPLSLGESGTLGRARKLIICEISEVTGETKAMAEEQIDNALTRNNPTPADQQITQ
jgi:CarD family transcriptional regulator, regulator of rRNA transcription